MLQEKARSTADWSAQHARIIFGVQFERKYVITSKPTWKSKHANSIPWSSEYFCQISSKLIHIISSYTTVSYLGRFWDTVSIKYLTRHLPYPCFSRNFLVALFGVDPWCCGIFIPKTQANQPWNYFRCIKTYLITILKRHGHTLSILRYLRYQISMTLNLA